MAAPTQNDGISKKELQAETAAVTSDVQAIAQQFVTAYYQTFDTNRAALASLYHPEAVLTFEGEVYKGQEKLLKKLISLPFQAVAHQVTTFDVQMTVDGGLIVFIVGQLQTDNDPVNGFSQVFHLKQVGDSIFLLNDMFRLNLHHQ